MIKSTLQPRPTLRGAMSSYGTSENINKRVKGVSINHGVVFYANEEGIVDVWITGGVGVDNVMDATSNNPVQNHVVLEAIEEATSLTSAEKATLIGFLN